MTRVFTFFIDINECEVENGQCEHTCVNTDGSFFCMCRDGYKLMNDRTCKGWYRLFILYKVSK